MSARHCEFTDAILAHFLDGAIDPVEVDSDGWARAWTAAELAEHRGECDECALAMANARRLDALVAASTTVQVDDEFAARAFDAVESRTADAECVGVQPRSRRWILIAGAVVCVVLGFAAAELLRRDPPGQPRRLEPVVPVAEPAVTPPMVAKREIALPPVVAAPAKPMPEPRVELPSPSERSMFVAAWSRAVSLGLPRSVDSLLGDARAARSAIRVATFERLVTKRYRREFATIVRELAAWGGEDLELAVDLVRRRPPVLNRLTVSVPRGSDELVAAAALIGGEAMDRKLIRRVRGSEDSCVVVVDSVSRVIERPGRVALLIRMWEELRMRGVIEDEFALAVRWFVPQPDRCSDELLEFLQLSRDAEERRLCLLAIAARGEASACDALIELADGARHDEAVLAAFALGQIAPDEDDLVDRRLRRRDYLRLCALACRRDGRIVQFIEGMRLSLVERQFLVAGGFNEDQFRIAALLCRERGIPSAFSDE